TLRWLFGQLTAASLIAGAVVDPLAFMMVVGALDAYYSRVAQRDRLLAPEVGAGATLRRWYIYTLSFLGLLTLLFAAASLLETLWEAFVLPPATVVASPDWLARAVAPRVSWAIVGLIAWIVLWTWSNRWFANRMGADPETRSVLRKVYLYLVLAVAVA